MKFTLSWLADYLDTSENLTTISEKLTSLGLEVEKVENRAEKLAPFKVAQIVEAKPHPNADKLRLCTVDSGSEKLQIVCGAANARTGIKVVLAPIGATIPANGMVIKKTSIRNVESNGMLCSNEELGLDGESEGIIELPENAKVGDSFVKSAGLDDPVIEIAITPNRGDCLGVYGIARDLSAAGTGKLKKIKIEKVNGTYDSPVKVKIEDEKACPLFVGRYFRNVKNRQSPDWLQNRLKAIGLRPISALVDITNYIAYDLGRPLHVYDAKKLNGDLIARKAKKGEKIQALNGKEYSLDNEIVIADQKAPVAIAGVIGGEKSGCTEETTEVFLEVALFDPAEVAKSGRKLQIDSDSRYRFERHVDPAFLLDAAEISSKLIMELCGGEPSKLEIAGNAPSSARKINFDFAKVKNLGGVEIDKQKAMQILQFLGFEVKEAGGKFDITVPSWRNDVNIEEDIVEEILRIHGYDKIPVIALENKDGHSHSVVSPKQNLISKIRRNLAARGMAETVNFSFIDSQISKNFIANDEDLKLINPISSELDIMRQTLIPALLQVVIKNSNRGFEDLSLFEVGPQFSSADKDMQRLVAAGIRSGLSAPKNIYKESRPVDLFDAKSDIFSCIAETVNPENLKLSRDCPVWYHPGKSGSITLGKTVLGYFGEIHPAILQKFDITLPIAAFELFIENLPLPKNQKSKGKLEISNFQHVERDFAFLIDEKTSAAEIISTVRSLDKELIESVYIFDIYQGKNVDAGKKSIAFSVRLQPKDKTLTQPEIDALSSKIISEVTTKLGGILRS